MHQTESLPKQQHQVSEQLRGDSSRSGEVAESWAAQEKPVGVPAAPAPVSAPGLLACAMFLFTAKSRLPPPEHHAVITSLTEQLLKVCCELMTTDGHGLTCC